MCCIGRYATLLDVMERRLPRSRPARCAALPHRESAYVGTGGVMDGEPGWVPPEVDVKRANIARVYDYLLGGSHNFLADQDLGRSLAATDPSVRAIARANRDFLGRAVRFLA